MRHDGIGGNTSKKITKGINYCYHNQYISINQTQTFSGKVKKKDFDDIVSCMVYKGILSCFPLIKKKKPWQIQFKWAHHKNRKTK